MAETIKLRFVGGSRHNDVIECSKPPVIYFPKPVAAGLFLEWPPAVAYAPAFESESYFLFEFPSEGGARFWQYVHESLIVDGVPSRESYVEPEALPGLTHSQTH